MGQRFGPGDISHAFLESSSSGDHEIVGAPGAGKHIEVAGWSVANNSLAVANTLHWRSGTTQICGEHQLPAAGQWNYGPVSLGLLECAPDEALVLHLNASVATAVDVWYVIVG